MDILCREAAAFFPDAQEPLSLQRKGLLFEPQSQADSEQNKSAHQRPASLTNVWLQYQLSSSALGEAYVRLKCRLILQPLDYGAMILISQKCFISLTAQSLQII